MHKRNQPFRRFFWSAHPARAIAEAWLWGLALLVLLRQLAETAIPAAMGNGWLALAGTAGMWAVLRVRVSTGVWWRRALRELGIGLALSLIMAAGIIGPMVALRWQIAWQAAFAKVFPVVVLMLGIGPGFVATRCVAYVGLYWDRLRRRRMLWSLTHMHLAVVVIVISLGTVVVLVTNPPANILHVDPNSDSAWAALLSELLTTFFPAAIAMLFMLAVMLIIVLPPSALLSFLMARKTTRRLEDLTRATGALCGGDYASRVVVSGEDEVAQLQANFNTMAETLGATLHDLEAERDKVARLLQARQVLVASVSHELRTPIATARGYLESLEAHDPAPERLAHDLGVVKTEILHLQRLLDDLFTLSKAEVEALTLNLQPVDVKTIVERRLAALASLAWERESVTLASDLPADLPPVRADEGRLDQILTNLLRNALRHTPPGGIVLVRAAATAEQVRIDVCDTGSGITAEDLPHIWERFYRGDEASAQDQQGAGLGLPLVKELAEAMGGAVDVQSTVGEGSCFSVWLPRAEPVES